MFAGAAVTEITPSRNVWLDGMIRTHPSVGVHDALYARALVLGNTADPAQAFALASVDVCVLSEATTWAVRQAAAAQTGIPAGQIVIAATHTHSGPATLGIFNSCETAYVEELIGKLAAVIGKAAANLRPAQIGAASGREETISHYRRLLTDDGRVVMNWEPCPPERIVGPLGVADLEVGVLKVVAASDPQAVIGLLFNHAGHPNILSGDNYWLSAEYPGLAAHLLEAEFGGIALFVNGANGSVDIDGLRHRDWEGLARAGHALADSAAVTARAIVPSVTVTVRGASKVYTLPGRTITDAEWQWAQQILASTGGQVQALPDGVGDDFKAVLYRRLRQAGPRPLHVEQTCLAFGDCAWLTFPGELYTEIGQRIKAASPFAHTYIIGLANGYCGYIPTRKAIGETGYAEDTRLVDAAAEEMVVEQSLALLRAVYDSF